MRAELLLVPFGLLAACETARPDVIPIVGPLPDQILLAPAVGVGIEDAVLEAFDRNVRQVIETRGYRVVPVDVAVRMLEDLSWTRRAGSVATLPTRGLFDQFAVDAVLTTEVDQLGNEGFGSGSLRVNWRLWRTSTGETQWRTELVGSPRRSERRMITGPISEDDPFFSDEPMLGRMDERWTYTQPPETVDEFVAGFQRQMSLRLPFHEDDGG